MPKFLIDIDGKKMIEAVIEMFDFKDKFYFVMNSEQLKDNPDIIGYLKSICKNVSVTVIDPHEEGPVFSALQVKNINDNEPIIISYCDFTIKWNYNFFLRSVVGFDCAIPAFIGFNPASFKKTKFAYMNVDKNSNLLELKEKESFTNERHNEFASVGIYYFSKFILFKNYAEKLISIGYGNLKEGYVSLLSNIMLKDNLKVLVTKVDKFICLGTPEDVNDYIYWSSFFKNKNNMNNLKYKIQNKNTNKNKVNLIPMAGKGSRFKAYDYETKKPFILIGNEPMYVKLLRSLPNAKKNIIVALKEDEQKLLKLDKIDQKLSSKTETITIDKQTSGQLTTCMYASNYIKEDDELLISSCDYEVGYNKNKFERLVKDSSIDIIIWCTKLSSSQLKNPKAFAYCKTNKDNLVMEVVEKDTISSDPSNDPLVTGIFWFRQAKDFFDLSKIVLRYNINVNGEHYIGNGLNQLIKKNKIIKIFYVDHWISFGDPHELNTYYFWDEYFN